MRSFADNVRKFSRLLTHRRASYPEEIQIEITNACNLTCAMCPHTFGDIPAQHFSLEQFEALVGKNPPPKRLVLTGWGEPLLHPDIFPMIECVNKSWSSTQVRFTTNGILLNEENREKLKSCSVAQVTVSLDLWPEREISPSLHRVLHPSSPKIIRNLELYCQDTDLADRSPLVLQSLLVEENVDDVKNLIFFAGEQGIQTINLVRLQPYPGIPLQRPAWEDEQRMIAFLKQWGIENGVAVQSLNQQSFAVRFATGFDRLCVKTDDSMYILMDGQVTPCCNLRNYTIGSLEEAQYSIASLWNSQKELDFFKEQNAICGQCDALFHRYRPQG